MFSNPYVFEVRVAGHYVPVPSPDIEFVTIGGRLLYPGYHCHAIVRPNTDKLYLVFGLDPHVPEEVPEGTLIGVHFKPNPRKAEDFVRERRKKAEQVEEPGSYLMGYSGTLSPEELKRLFNLDRTEEEGP